MNTATRLAYEHTRLSYDRTVLAAIRTATSLITFGFTVYKIFEFEIAERDHNDQLVGPREFGITMIFVGLTTLLLASYEYRRDRNDMRKLYPDMPRSTAGLVASLIAALGILALFAAIFRH